MHTRLITILSATLLVCSAFVLAGAYSSAPRFSETSVEEMGKNNAMVLIEGVRIEVEIVQTQEERSRGLSGRLSLPEGTGMLFVMDSFARHGMWMPGMHFPIDIIWLDGDMRVVDIKENATPESYPEVFKPENSARYVLEVPSGFSKKYNVQQGSKATFETLAQ